MKIALLIVGLLLVTIGGHAESNSNWQDKLNADLDRMYQRLEEEAEARQKRLEADAKRREEEAEALSKKLEADAKRREEEAEAREKQLEADAKRREEEAEALSKRLEADAKRREEEAKALSKRLEADAKRREEEAEDLSKRLEAEAKRREEEAEAREKQLEADAKRREEEAEALSKRLEADAKRREEEAEARQKKLQAELNELNQKCAKKGFASDIDFSKGISSTTNSIDGFRHIFVHTYNSATKKLSGSYYRVNEQDPTAEPICGKLEIEPTSDGETSVSDADSRDIVMDGISFNGYQNEDELVKLGQKCAEKGFPNEIDLGAKRMVTLTIAMAGIQHKYVQTYNSATKKVSGSYFRTNLQNGDLTCGKLKIESTS